MMKTRSTRRPPRADANTDPGQREHELSDALTTLLIAVSRYGGRSDADRLELIQHLTVLLAHGIADRVRLMCGTEAASAFRKALAGKGPPQ